MTARPGDEQPAPGADGGPATIAGESALLVDVLMAGFTARSDRAGPKGESASAAGERTDHTCDEATVGCSCGGRGAAARCPGCAMCHVSELWHSLDPRILDNLADVAALIGDGLRSAARRLADDRPEHSHRGRTSPS